MNLYLYAAIISKTVPMKRVVFTCLLILLTLSLWAQKATVIHAPHAVPKDDARPKIFLGGSIDMGAAEDWQAWVEGELIEHDVILLNPRRGDWDPSWEPVSTNPNFRQQVEWELTALEQADVIIMYFAPTSKSPISLLELGLYAREKKLMVVCPEGFWRKGNVDIVCQMYSIPMYDSLEELLITLKNKILPANK